MEKYTNLFGEPIDTDWVIFHDESKCEQENFLYHGFLFVAVEHGRKILKTLLQPNPKYPSNFEKRIHFTDLTGFTSSRSHVARSWIRLSKEQWLKNGALRFYCLGVNLNNINYDLYQSSQKYYTQLPNKHDRIYRRFFEIGLKAAVRWFQLEASNISHLYFDQGKQDRDRYYRTMEVLGHETKIYPLFNDCVRSQNELSKYLQLTDVLLGTIRKSFTPLSNSKTAQQECVKIMSEVTTQFTSEESAYDYSGDYWKKVMISFYPRTNNLTPEEFFNRDIAYHQKTQKLFYHERPLYKEKVLLERQTELFDS